jgi:hypothetical protein
MFDDGPDDPRTVNQLPRQGRRARETAADLARRVRPEYTERRKKNIDQATSAVLGAAANLGVAAVAGLVGGRLHPEAPQVLYSVFATATGYIVAEENPTMGGMLTAGGMVAGAGLVLRAVISLVTKTAPSSLPSSPFDVANRVAQVVSSSPTVSPSPTPTAVAAAATPGVPYITPTPSRATA